MFSITCKTKHPGKLLRMCAWKTEKSSKFKKDASLVEAGWLSACVGKMSQDALTRLWSWFIYGKQKKIWKMYNYIFKVIGDAVFMRVWRPPVVIYVITVYAQDNLLPRKLKYPHTHHPQRHSVVDALLLFGANYVCVYRPEQILFTTGMKRGFDYSKILYQPQHLNH